MGNWRAKRILLLRYRSHASAQKVGKTDNTLVTKVLFRVGVSVSPALSFEVRDLQDKTPPKIHGKKPPKKGQNHNTLVTKVLFRVGAVRPICLPAAVCGLIGTALQACFGVSPWQQIRFLRARVGIRSKWMIYLKLRSVFYDFGTDDGRYAQIRRSQLRLSKGQ
jgi:hypothetical protein